MRFQAALLAAAAVLLAGCGSQNGTPQAASPSAAAGDASPNSPQTGTAGTPTPSSTPVALVEVPRGAELRARTVEALDTSRNNAGDRFEAVLSSPVTAGDHIVLERGTRVQGRVVEAYRSGRLRGRAYIGVTLDTVELNGVRYRIETSTEARVSATHKKRNLVAIGGGSGVGALIGGLAGGGKGAAIGAAAGAGAGTAGAAATGVLDARIPPETVLRFTLRVPLQVPGGRTS